MQDARRKTRNVKSNLIMSFRVESIDETKKRKRLEGRGEKWRRTDYPVVVVPGGVDRRNEESPIKI